MICISRIIIYRLKTQDKTFLMQEPPEWRKCVALCWSQPAEGVGAGPGAAGLEHIRREAQLAALQYEEERHRGRPSQKEVLTYAKLKAAQSPSKHSLSENQSSYPSRRSTHTDDSALFMQSEDHSPPLSHLLRTPPQPTNCLPVLALWPRLPIEAPPPIPNSFLLRLGQREDARRADLGLPKLEAEETTPPEPQGFVGEEAELVEQLRKNIESRLKVSLPSDLGAALTDGVVLCHLANHVRPRSVPSIHVPSPAVPKLTMAKCRRNVENFLEACRRLGVPQAQLCLPLHILEEKGLPLVAGTVDSSHEEGDGAVTMASHVYHLSEAYLLLLPV
ncbi:hypothetical protein SKAU_G00206600 [Synaphobranchus kaupii]|uniref:Calponin-homology (CH) domain-containing protein n=1 Tax=Synaphobranchus kaupii TaxID=118154 RepID=A0A9Q1IYC4_SYNKA|nr:hypothetical protein SKAU_G00206600 [Synaphobranchus kaupii]